MASVIAVLWADRPNALLARREAMAEGVRVEILMGGVNVRPDLKLLPKMVRASSGFRRQAKTSKSLDEQRE